MSHLNKIFSIENITEENADEQFFRIAEEILGHCYINLDGVVYKFLEIEFYFWSSTHEDNKKDGKPFVYKRCNPEPAQYFIHSSGIDLCLKSNSGFGGILIRSLLRIVGGKVESVVTGPIACCDTLINYTGGTSEKFPKLVYEQEVDTPVSIGVAERCNVPEGCTMREKKYCFYNKAYKGKNNKWSLDEKELKRYDPARRELEENKYSAKPWNRELK